MNDILMICVLAGLLVLTGCLIQSICRMAFSNSRRIRWCRQVTAVGLYVLCLLVLPVRQLLLAGFASLMEAPILAGFWDAVLVKRNYEMQYVLLFQLYGNLVVLFGGWVLLKLLDLVSDRGEVLVFLELPFSRKLLHLPWLLADICYENREESRMLRPWAAVLGKWMKNLSSILLFCMAVPIIPGVISLYIRIPWLAGEMGAKRYLAGYLMPCVPWLISCAAAGFLNYCPKERPDHVKKKAFQTDPLEQELGEMLVQGNHVAVTKAAFDSAGAAAGENGPRWLRSFLLDCFQKRRRMVVVCTGERDMARWRELLGGMLKDSFDRMCVIRIGDVTEIQNQKDVDILLVTGEQLAVLEPDRIYPFWYQEVQTVILTDTHPLLAKTGGTEDAVFALWNKKAQPVQYLFLHCSGMAQELPALKFYAAGPVHVFGDADSRMEITAPDGSSQRQKNRILDLVPWCLDSQQGRMRRLLLAMEQENGVSEQWLKKQQERFGMEALGTEAFLTHVLRVVFPQMSVSNLYDTFLFQEEVQETRSRWQIRLTDRKALALLEAGEEENGDTVAEDSPFASFGDQIRMEDRCYHVSDPAPLLADLDQEKKRLILYQVTMFYERNGVFSFPVTQSGPDYTAESYLEEKASVEPCDVTMLRIVLAQKHAPEDSPYLSALLSLVCNQVLLELFPWNRGQAAACCSLEMNQRSIFQRAVMKEEDRPALHCITVDILETGKRECGLTAVLRINSREFFDACRSWLLRVKADGNSAEGKLMAYAHQQLGKSTEDWDGTGKLLELLK